jgi:hypothetical protein
LLSNWTTAVPAERATPLFVAGLVIHPCTSVVTSMATKVPAWATEKTLLALPMAGWVA